MTSGNIGDFPSKKPIPPPGGEGRRLSRADENENRLHAIFKKVMEKQALAKGEHNFLLHIVEGDDTYSGPKISKDQANNILDKLLSIFQEDTRKAPRQQIAKAKVLLDTLYIFNNFFEKIKSIKNPTRETIASLISRHNACCPPDPEKAGLLAMSIGKNHIYYDHCGRLILAPPSKKATEVIPLCKENRLLTPQKIDEIREIYRKIVNDTPYNTAAPLLEFIRFFRLAKRTNPDLTVKEAFAAYIPSPERLYDKYRTGNCVILAQKLQTTLQEQGLKAAVIGQYTNTRWSRPPIPMLHGQKKIDWKEYDQTTENVHHTAVVLRYSNWRNKEKGILFEMGNFKNDEIYPYDSWKDLSLKVFLNGTKKDTCRHITNVGQILKMHLQGKPRTIITGQGNSKQIFGIDLLRGNIYLSSKGAEGLSGLPLYGYDRFSIRLEDLKDPTRKGIYTVDGEDNLITHREALFLFAKVAKERFLLPDDFVENIIALAENVDPLFDHVFLSPSQAVRRLGKGPKKVAKLVQKRKNQLSEIKEVFDNCGKQFSKHIWRDLREIELAVHTLESLFGKLQRVMLKNDATRAIESIQQIIKENNRIKSLYKKTNDFVNGFRSEPKSGDSYDSYDSSD